MKTRYSRYQRK